MLAERLAQRCRAQVVEATEGMLCTPGLVMIAPGDHHLELRSDGTQLHAHLHRAPPVNSCRPAVDVLFNSAAAACGSATLGIVLTGLGRDGCDGARRLVDSGGEVLAQDEATSVVWGMPGAVAKAGLARAVLPIHEIAPAIQARLGSPAAAIARRL
jgi:two-component system chemotaxis response regulator CheB